MSGFLFCSHQFRTQLIFKKSYKNLAKNLWTQETCNSAFLTAPFSRWSVKSLKTFCPSAGAHGTAPVRFERPGPHRACVPKITVEAAGVNPCVGRAGVDTSLRHPHYSYSQFRSVERAGGWALWSGSAFFTGNDLASLCVTSPSGYLLAMG